MPDTMEKAAWFIPLDEVVSDLPDIDIPPDLPDGFVEAQVIFRELNAGALNPFYEEIDEPTPVVNNGDYLGIEDLVGKVARGEYVRNRDDEEEASLLDIRVTYPSYIVLRLHEDLNATFSEDPTAIKLGAPVQDADLYGQLRYVRSDGTIASEPESGCRVVFFAAMPAFGTDADPYRQKLNYYVISQNQIGVVVDPDIRHPGNGNS